MCVIHNIIDFLVNIISFSMCKFASNQSEFQCITVIQRINEMAPLNSNPSACVSISAHVIQTLPQVTRLFN